MTALFVLLPPGDQLAIAKETGRRLGMGSNMYPSSSLLGEHKNGLDASLQIDGGGGCMAWHGELMDTLILAEQGKDFYVRADGTESGTTQMRL